MASSRAVPRPNHDFRRLRGPRSPAEFAAAVRRAAREIGEQVACDARYVGRVEAGEIRCPNYAYERVFLHMFPGLTMADLGFTPRAAVRGRSAVMGAAVTGAGPHDGAGHESEESDVRRRAFMSNGGAATVAVAVAGLGVTPSASRTRHPVPAPRRVGESEVRAVEEEVRRIRLLDDRHGADVLYRRAAEPLRYAYALLDSSTVGLRALADRLHAGTGELAVSVGWLAHDSGRFDAARSHYAEALATARVAEDPGLEAHAFCNTAFLASDAGRHREAVRAAQAGSRAAERLSSPRLLSLLTLREAVGWSGLGDRSACARCLVRATTLFDLGPSDGDPEWMSFFNEPELAWQEARCHAALGNWARAARHAHRATLLQEPHFTRNLALYRAESAAGLARSGAPDEAALAGRLALDLMRDVRSSRVTALLGDTARTLLPHRNVPEVREFLDRHADAHARTAR